MTQENEYPGGIFVPMYDQNGAQVPVSTQQSEQNATATDYRRNCGVPLAFFEQPSTGELNIFPDIFFVCSMFYKNKEF